MRVLITGITGFAGSHLAEYLLAQHPDVAVYGTYRWRSRMENLEELFAQQKLDVIEGRYPTGASLRDDGKKGRVTLLHCELTDAGAVEKLVSSVQPQRVFHLAAQSFVQSSFDEPASTLRINIESQLNVLEAIRRHDTQIRIHVAGSSEEYGLVHPDEVPMKETNPLRPLSPYAVSKVAQDKLAYQYFKSYGLHVVVTRGFNHTGPRRGLIFVTSTFARQIALIEAGKHEPVIYHGDLTSKRDWTDVRASPGSRTTSGAESAGRSAKCSTSCCPTRRPRSVRRRIPRAFVRPMSRSCGRTPPGSVRPPAGSR